MVAGILKVKLGACRTGPTKRLHADLLAVARLCNVARNAMARAWQRWHEDHPDWRPEAATDSEGKPKLRRDGSPILRSGIGPAKFDYEGRQIGLSTWLYHAGRRVAPTLAANTVSTLAGEVESRLKAAMPYNHEGRAKQRWQAVLWNEVNLDTYRSLTVPVPNNTAALCYAGDCSRDAKVSQAVRDRLHRHGDSGCTLAMPLFSGAAGREWTSAVASLVTSKFSAGQRALLRRVARGEWKLSDSELVRREGRGWYFHLTYQQPDDALPVAEGDAVATLSAESEGEYPFTVESGERRWRVGHGPLLAREFARLDRRRRDFRSDYRTAGSARRGHGRARNERDLRPVTRAIQNLTNRIAAQAAAEVVRFCTRFGCSSLAWEVPALARRDRLWFAAKGVQWDWTLFENRLNHQCRRAGVRVVPA